MRRSCFLVLALATLAVAAPAQAKTRVAHEKSELVSDDFVESGTVSATTRYPSKHRSSSRVRLTIRLRKAAHVRLTMAVCTIVSPRPCSDGPKKQRVFDLQADRTYHLGWRVKMRSKKAITMQLLTVFPDESSAMYSSGYLPLWRLTYWERCPECKSN